ncbi:MAG TPA: DUF721 domain-containing protein [Gaiellaceae bacterium]|nr:DUF721 domain-containing protein [Gaiellaceae bacterium]
MGRFGAAGAIGEVVAAWPDAVGPAIAQNAWPARIARDGTLVVAASASVWAFELTKLAGAIHVRLRERLGERTPPRLRFVVGRLPERGAEPVAISPRAVPQVSEAARRAASEIAATIENEELRDLVARAAAASLARRSRGRG